MYPTSMRRIKIKPVEQLIQTKAIPVTGLAGL
jgi:hypothetical protein